MDGFEQTSWIIENIIRKRIYKTNQNFLGLIAGGVGTGKTYTGIEILTEADPTFNIDRIAFTRDRFFEILQPGNLEKGNSVLFDEASTGMSSRTWQSEGNRLVNFILQTFRRDNLIVFFTTPSWGFLDNQIRAMFNGYIEPIRINRDLNICTFKFMNVTINPYTGDVFRKYPRKDIDEPPYNVEVLDRAKVKRMPIKMVREYEEMKKEFADTIKTDALERTIQSKLLLEEKAKKKTIKEMIDEVREKRERYIRFHPERNRNFLDKSLLEADFEIGGRKSEVIKKVLEKEFGFDGTSSRENIS